jgi:hypothetical protein
MAARRRLHNLRAQLTPAAAAPAAAVELPPATAPRRSAEALKLLGGPPATFRAAPRQIHLSRPCGFSAANRCSAASSWARGPVL